jgi:hypothetical protein
LCLRARLEQPNRIDDVSQDQHGTRDQDDPAVILS